MSPSEVPPPSEAVPCTKLHTLEGMAPVLTASKNAEPPVECGAPGKASELSDHGAHGHPVVSQAPLTPPKGPAPYDEESREEASPLTTDFAERFFLVRRVSAISAAEVSRLRLQVDLRVQTLMEVLRRSGHRESERALASVRVSEDPQLLFPPRLSRQPRLGCWMWRRSPETQRGGQCDVSAQATVMVAVIVAVMV